MAYKIPVTQEKFIQASKLNESAKTKQTEMDDKQINSQEIKQKLDYFINLMDRYRGKTIDDIAKEKYGSEYIAKDETTDGELHDKAKLYADTITGEKVNKVMLETESDLSNLNEKERLNREETSQKLAKIDNEFDEMKKDSKSKAIKNGIARSSIIENLLNAQENQRKVEKSEVNEKSKIELEEIAKKIDAVEENLKKSLANLDMQSAVLLNDELTKLKAERDKRNQQISAHNEKVDKKIRDYANELVKTEDGKAIKDFIEDNSGKLVSEGKRLLIEYYDSLPVEKAQEELEKGEVERVFGLKTVNMLRKYLQEKAKYSN